MGCHSVAGLVFKSPSFHFIVAPKCKRSDAGSLDVPERSGKVCVCTGKTVYIGFSTIPVSGVGGGVWNEPRVDTGDFFKLKYDEILFPVR